MGEVTRVMKSRDGKPVLFKIGASVAVEEKCV